MASYAPLAEAGAERLVGLVVVGVRVCVGRISSVDGPVREERAGNAGRCGLSLAVPNQFVQSGVP